VNLYGASDAPPDPNETLLQKTGKLAKWVARSTLKASLCMLPAVPFFSITRSTQNRSKALFIDPETNSALGFFGKDGKIHYLEAGMVDALRENGVAEHGLTRDTPVSYGHYDPQGNHGYGQLSPAVDKAGNFMKYDAKVGNPIVREGFGYYNRRHNLPENIFSSIGRWGEKLSRVMDGTAKKITESAEKGGIGSPIRWAFGLTKGEDFKRAPRGFINASMSYTPYMFMKGETARLWDSGKTDLALERVIDGATHLDWREVKSGWAETWSAILHKPFADPDRDREANRRILVDTSQADDLTEEDAARVHKEQIHEQGRYYGSPSPDSKLSWRERTVQGKQPEDILHSAKHSPKSHAEREEMREFLENVTPPTHSIH
jgi:hypothetical protein